MERGNLMNTIQLQCFLAVAENLNFARAAEEIHITQPAVTHQINSLENELGVKLFKRTTRSVSLTTDGFRFLSDAKKILNDMHIAKMRLVHKEETEPVIFSIGCHTSRELIFFPDLLKKIQLFAPSIHPVIKTLPMRALNNLLQTDGIDILFSFQENEKTAPGKFVELYKAPIVCVFPATHPLAFAKVIHIEDLLSEQLTVQEPPNTHPAVFTLQSQILQNHNPSDMLFCESYEAAITLTKAEMGITILPDIIPIRDPALCYVPFEGNISVPYGIYYKTLKNQPLIKKFITLAKEYFSSF